MSANNDLSKVKLGKVILAGAGPGDPELITLKALRYLQIADVVIVDRLVSEDLLSQHLKAGAKVIYVGKQAGKNGSTSQEVINNLLVEHSKSSQLVVRLKGGDVTFFSNVLDELKTLVEHNIPYEIIPGVTAASGAAAYAGIPLTARGYASSVRFLAFNRTIVWDEPYWKELAATDDTLVFYMSMDVLDMLVERLLANEISSDKYMALIEQATTPSQKVHMFSLSDFDRNIQGLQFISPTLIIVGRVAALNKEFQWVPNDTGTTSYFTPVPDEKNIN